MRAALAGVVLALLAGPALAQQGQDSGSGASVIVIAPAPAVVAAPTPQAPAAPVAPLAPPPPGLIPVAPPPTVDTDTSAGTASAVDGASTPPAATAPPLTIAPRNATGLSDQPPALPQQWVPKATATLGVLDKVDGSTSTVSIAKGTSQAVGDLSVQVLACVARPPDEAPDSAIFVVVEPAPPASTGASGGGAVTPGQPIYRGWIVKSAPGAAVVGDATESFRVIGCS